MKWLDKIKHRRFVIKRAKNINKIRMDILPNEIFDKLKETFNPALLVKRYSNKYIYDNKISITEFTDEENCVYDYSLRVEEIEIEASFNLSNKIYRFLEDKYNKESVPLRIRETINTL